MVRRRVARRLGLLVASSLNLFVTSSLSALHFIAFFFTAPPNTKPPLSLPFLRDQKRKQKSLPRPPLLQQRLFLASHAIQAVPAVWLFAKRIAFFVPELPDRLLLPRAHDASKCVVGKTVEGGGLQRRFFKWGKLSFCEDDRFFSPCLLVSFPAGRF